MKKAKTTTITFSKNELDELHLLLDNGWGDGEYEEAYMARPEERKALHRGWRKITRARRRLFNLTHTTNHT